MKRINELKTAIASQDQKASQELVDELENDLRDFSQCIVVSEAAGLSKLAINEEAGTDEYMVERKRKIRKWVGGR